MVAPSPRIWAGGLEIIGGGLVTAAIIWWVLVYYQVFLNTGFDITGAVPCLVHTSDTCSLAMSLCGGKHFLGLKRYSETLLWFGLAVSSLAFLLRVRLPRT